MFGSRCLEERRLREEEEERQRLEEERTTRKPKIFQYLSDLSLDKKEVVFGDLTSIYRHD